MPRKATEGARSFEALARLAREAGDGEVSEAKHVAGRARLMATIEHDRDRRSSRGAMYGVMALAATVLLVLGARGLLKWRTPGWTVEGAVAQGTESQGFVRAPSSSPATIRFADGSAVALSPKGRARVLGSERRHVVLEEGHAEVRVAPGGPMLAWAFDAGPFTVRASAGAMAMEWSGDGEQLDVWPHDGETTVQGGVAGSGVTLHGGDHLTARVREGELRIVRVDGAVTTTNDAIAPAPPSTNAIVTTTPDARSSSPVTAPPAPAAAAKSGGSNVSWPALVARGDYTSLLRDAEANGIDGALAHRPLPDLAALADASRYLSRTDVAERALTAERSRFPGSKEAHTAAFLLGRLADDQQGAPARAVPWYDRYLAEAPTGPFASDALGRKMLAVKRTQGPDAARPIADQYARRFPHGAYAAQADELRTQ
jgi:TolA-binding protein